VHVVEEGESLKCFDCVASVVNGRRGERCFVAESVVFEPRNLDGDEKRQGGASRRRCLLSSR
jgi:hypothetical protein